MDDYEKIREIIREEVAAIENDKDEYPDRYSCQGKFYWKGNVAGLKWILDEMEGIRLSTQTAIKEGK